METATSGLLVGQGFDGVFAAGHPSRVRRAQQAPDDRDNSRFDHPIESNDDGKGGEKLEENGASGKRNADSDDHADEAKKSRLAEDYLHDVGLRSTQRLEHANFTSPLDDRGVHGEENHEKADGYCDTDHGVDKCLEAGEARGGH